MKNAVIFGAAMVGKVCYDEVKNNVNVLCFVDNNYAKHRSIPGLPEILSPDVLESIDFDTLYIAVVQKNIANEIYAQCISELGIPEHKVNMEFAGEETLSAVRHRSIRVNFMEQFARYVYLNSIKGSVAELGVYRGDFAKEINRAFPDKKLFLFDTFEGFSEKDFMQDEKVSDNFNYTKKTIELKPFTSTSVDIVLGNLPFPENAVIKKGYFPETFDIKNEQFCFVNIDADLYKPIKSGLELFFPRMGMGGIILVHDVLGFTWGGALQAVKEFSKENKISPIPIGDYTSVAFVKN